MRVIRIYRRKPELLKSLPRLLARLHPGSPKVNEIQDYLYRVRAGYSGEIKVDKYLESIEFPEPVKILADVQLPVSPNYEIQIDTLILTPSSILILEIKNIAGTLTYIPNPPHFERTHEDKKSIVVDCPIMQLNNNQMGLDIWLQKNNFPIRSTGLIIMANNSTSVKNAPPDMPIMYAKHLPLHLRKRGKGTAVLTNKQFYHLINRLEQDQETYNPYPLCKRYKIDPTHIKKGLLCNYCNKELIRRNHMTWYCSACRENAQQPFKDGLQDWVMLMKNTISNAECRDFLQLKNKYAANYILKNIPLHRTGESKATIYSWNYKISPSQISKNRKATSR